MMHRGKVNTEYWDDRQGYFPRGTYVCILTTEVTLKRLSIFTRLYGVTSWKSVHLYSVLVVTFPLYLTDGHICMTRYPQPHFMKGVQVTAQSEIDIKAKEF